jgi:hypothetical protein
MASNFKIGVTSGGITSLDALTTACPDPQQSFNQFRRKDRLGDMTMKGRGPQTIVWIFPLLEVEQIAQLETFQSDYLLYIQSPKRDDSLGVFEVLMVWNDPREDGEHMNGFRGHRGNLSIEFIVISEVV